MRRLTDDHKARLAPGRLATTLGGGVKWGVWDREMHTWRDDLGIFLTRKSAEEAIAFALPGDGN